MQRLSLLAAGSAALFAVGCAGRGNIEGGGGSTTGSGNSGSGSSTGSGGSSSTGPDGGTATDPDAGPMVMQLPSSLSPPDPCTSGATGPRKLWRLSAPEFTASIHSIFNDTAGNAPVATVFSDQSTLGF